MNSESQGIFLSKVQKILLLIFFVGLISVLLFLKNIFFESTLLLKSFGKNSIDPNIAFMNNKPTFLEFYAEWCEVCKEMAPGIAQYKKDFDDDINFVFLNVDNPKWDKFIKKFNVNGIPQVNIFDSNAELKGTFIGLQDENLIRNSIINLSLNNKKIEDLSSTKFSELKLNENKISPRSHG